MRRLVILLVFFFLVVSSFGQTNEIVNWRYLGYLAKTDKDFASAIEYYQKILAADSADYDAKLALARLYIITNEYHTAINFFNELYKNDSTDVEAMNGMGECYGLLGQDRKSIYYFEQALSFLPDDIQQHFYLAKAYGNGGKMNQAIEVYRQINQIDETYSEAWAGIGKMYFWMGKPKSAVVFYKRALDLDSENEEIKKEYLAVQSELDYALSIHFGPVIEKEENYEINAMISKVGFEKRIDDNFHIQTNFLLDYSNRDYKDNTGDTARWYNNSWVIVSWIAEHHKISVFGGYSNTDNKVSIYGLNWKLNYNAGRISIKNSVNAGYDYFYYWNKVGGKSVTDEVQLSYGILGLNARYTFGMIDAVFVNDYISNDTSGIRQNPYQAYGLSLTCKILKKPAIKVGINHSFLDYKYKSPLYYSPYGRKLTGGSVSIYYDFLKFYIYGSFSYNIGTEYNYEEVNRDELQKVKMNVDNWSSNIELGYNHYPFSVSIGGSNFYNPYYQNITGFIAVKMLF
ncbi:MAG: tetratricopeptide repeat protein [Bacteroidales bacterium]|nr:tetratricopeptide repeat protein [Bacteroidales bacterium]